MQHAHLLEWRDPLASCHGMCSPAEQGLPIDGSGAALLIDLNRILGYLLFLLINGWNSTACYMADMDSARAVILCMVA